MDTPVEAVLLRIFTSVEDRWGLNPLYLAIVERARDMHLAGATVLRGSLGFGHSRRLHKGHLPPGTQDLPVVVEIVDTQERIDEFLPVLDDMMESGLVTLERANVLHYGRPRAGFMHRLRDQLAHGTKAKAEH
jgi:hypothetical protein